MNVYKRRGRPTWSFQAKTRSGWKQLSTGAKNQSLGKEIARMWGILADLREWNLMESVLAGQRSIGALYDSFVVAKGKIKDLRRLLEDLDVAALVPDFLTDYASGSRVSDTVAHTTSALDYLLPKGKPLKASKITIRWLTKRLREYPGRPATRRKIHSNWSVFFEYATKIENAFEDNPMLKVPCPAVKRSNPRFYELETVKRIVDYQPTPERKALFSLYYGSGIEVSTALMLRRDDVIAADREVRAPGTKASTRDRVVVVEKWAWKLFWAEAKTMLPLARIFPESWSRYTVSDWHRETLEALDLPVRYPLKNARHHWAATHLRSGWSIYAVQRQLGHSSPQLTLLIYGLFIPTRADRSANEKQYEKYEKMRISANRGAKGGAQ